MRRLPWLILPAILLVSCGNEETFEFTNREGITPYISEKSDYGKARIVDKNDNPVLMLSTLFRTDLSQNADFMKPSEMEDYFAIAKETGMNTMEIAIMWSEIETSYDVYDFSHVETYLNYAKKYDLKLNLEWYGSLVDGEFHSVNVPSYVSMDTAKYPVIADMFDFANYGRCKILKWDHPLLLDRESKALYSMMNYIGEWNAKNNRYDPVISVQIGQGADRFQRWRIDAYKVKNESGELFDSESAWSMIKTYLNSIAKAVKFSSYKALTRVEFCEQSAVVNFVRNIKNLEYVDIVCPTYLHEISTTKSAMRSFASEWEDMAVLNVENWADDNNYRQILATMAAGGSGYVSYQLSSPLYYPELPNGALYGRYKTDQKTLQEKFVERNTRATDTKKINVALKKADVAIANAPRNTFAALGLNNLLNAKERNERVQKIYLQSGVLLDWSNPLDSIGFAVNEGNYLYAYSSKDAELTINGCSIPSISEGSFVEGEWEATKLVTLKDNKVLEMKEGNVYRIRLNDIQKLPDIEKLNAEGYLSTYDSIRG